jgi:hypothetical protein
MSITDGKLAYLGLNIPTSRHVWGRQQSRSMTSATTYVIHGWWKWTRCSLDSLAHLIPYHISSSSKLDLITTCTQAYDTTWARKAIVKVRDIDGHPCESHGRQSRVDAQTIWFPTTFEAYLWRECIVVLLRCHFCVVFLECLHQHSPCTHNIRNQYKYSTTIVLLPSSLSRRPSSS